MVSLPAAVAPLLDLAPFELDALQEEPSTVYALTPDLRIGYVNDAWSSFALANGARWGRGEWGIGRAIMDAVPAVLRPFHQELFTQAMTDRLVVEHVYECSSATTARRFRMRLLPCEQGGLLVVHSLLRATPQTEPGLAPLDALYRRSGMIVQCSHCRRVERASERGAWDWVPAYVDHSQPMTSHGLCRLCTDYYYSEVLRDG